MDETYPRPNTTTVPSDPTITISSSSESDRPPAPPKQPTSLQSLRLCILRYLARTARSTDTTLLRLSKLLSTPSGTDSLLCTISYTLTLTHALLSRLLEKKLAAVATDIAEKVDGILLPGETLIASIPAPASTKALAHIVGTSKALAETISDYRIFVRLWGLVGLYTWSRATYLDPLPEDASQKDKILRGLTWAAIASCVGFQVLENGAYLSSKGVLTSAAWTGDVGKARENKWWMWSSKFWAVYVGVELCRLGVVNFSDSAVSSTTSEGSLGDGEKEDKIRREELVRKKGKEKWNWWRDLVSNIAYAPMTVHWSLEEGLLSDWGVGACGVVAGGVQLVDAWKQTTL